MSRWHVNVIFAYFLEHLSMLGPKNIPHNMTPGDNRIFILKQQPVRFYLVGSHGVARVLDPFLNNLHHSSKNLWVRRFLDEGGEETWMKFFLISMFMTDSLSFTRSKLSMTNSLVTTVNIEEHDYMTAILFSLSLRFTGLLWFSKT